MAVQIVMDRTGDTRHEFDQGRLQSCRARRGAVPRADRQGLPRRRPGPGRRTRQAAPQVRSAGRADPVHPAAARRLMDRVGQILRALFRRALSEYGRDAPALIDIVIERAHGRLEPRIGVHFSNGYRTWSPLSPSDCYAFCERHGDLGPCRPARRPAARGASDLRADARGACRRAGPPAPPTRRAGDAQVPRWRGHPAREAAAARPTRSIAT